MATTKLNKLGKEVIAKIQAKFDVHSEGEYEVTNIIEFAYFTFDIVFPNNIGSICVVQVNEILCALEQLGICRAFFTIEILDGKPSIHVAMTLK